jgi:hypothetical protein
MSRLTLPVMRPAGSLALFLTAVCLAASCSPFAEPKGDRWQLTLTNEKSTIYGGSACAGQTGNLYCTTWVDDPYVFPGTLRRTYEWVLDVGDRGAFSGALASQKADSVSVEVLDPAEGCESYILNFRTQRDSIFGTFYHTSDCHTAASSGRFVGRP